MICRDVTIHVEHGGLGWLRDRSGVALMLVQGRSLRSEMSDDDADEPLVLRLGHPREPWRMGELAVLLWAQAAAVCLEDVGHGATVTMTVLGIPGASRVVLEAPVVDDAVRRTFRNRKPAVEQGAIAVVAALVHGLTSETLLQQSIEGTGIDYWLVDRDDPGPFFQTTSSIEISGILRESSSNSVEHRLRQKRERLSKYPDQRPAKIAVVEFSAPRTVMEEHV